jgi:hypothetical protein
MSEPTDAGVPALPFADGARIEDAIRDCERELARVGVTWQSLEQALSQLLAVTTPPRLAPTVGLDATSLGAVLRPLRDGAGLSAVLDALGRSGGTRPPAS